MNTATSGPGPYTAGQTAALELGPIVDVRTGGAYDPANLRFSLRGPVAFDRLIPVAGLSLVYPDAVGNTSGSVVVRTATGTYRVNAPLKEAGDYVAEWTWGTGDQIGESSVRLHVDPPGTYRISYEAAASWAPTVDQIGALDRARTKDSTGNELGTFTTATRPTAAQVLILIGLASSEVDARVDRAIHQAYADAARNVIALRTCMHIERGYFPEQTESRDSAYARFAAEYGLALADLLAAVQFPAL